MLLKSIGVILFIIGLIIRYIIARNRFNRRMVTGVELFKSYNRFLIIRILEKFGRLIAFILILAGIFFFIMGIFENIHHASIARIDVSGKLPPFRRQLG